MFKYLFKAINFLIASIATLLFFTASCSAQEYFPPSGASGKLVVVLSGATGPDKYQDFSQSISQLGYSVFLFDGNDVTPVGGYAATNLKRFILEAQKHPKVKSGNLVVVGLSLGGGGALVNAVQGENGIAGVIAMYPAIAKISRKNVASSSVKVPTLLIAGEKDTYNNCCLIEYMHEFNSAAKESAKPVELITYPNVGHGFNLKSMPSYKEVESEQSFIQVKSFLKTYLPKE